MGKSCMLCLKPPVSKAIPVYKDEAILSNESPQSLISS